MDKQIEQLLDVHQQAFVQHLCQLVNFESTYQNEWQAQTYIKQLLEELEMDIDWFEPDVTELVKHETFVSQRTQFQRSPNVIGVWKGIGGGQSLLLNSHIDVVPGGDVTQWQTPPFQAYHDQSRVFGRGTTDMKGGTISLLLALKVIKDLNIRLRGDLFFQSVVDEECGGAGTLAATLKGYKADAALIPEPTKLKIFPLQQGSLWFRIIIKGRAAHGGTRYDGVSAIDKAYVVIEQLQTLEKRRNDQIHHPLYEHIPIPIPINIGKISGGDWPSMVPDQVIIEGRYGVFFEETIEEAKETFEQILHPSMFLDPWFIEHPVSVEWFGAQWLPGSIDVRHPFLQRMNEVVTKVSGQKAVVEAAPWATDAGILYQVGQIPTIVYGPGTTELAHYPNESIEIAAMVEAAKVFVHLILSWCEYE